MHVFPGLVHTEIFAHLKAPETAGWLPWLMTAFMSGVASWMQWIIGISILDSGARMAWLLASDKFGPGKCWRIEQHCEEVVGQGILEEYREGGWREKVWGYNLGFLRRLWLRGNECQTVVVAE